MSKKSKKESKITQPAFPEEVFIQMEDPFGDEKPILNVEQEKRNLFEGRIAVYRLHKTGKVVRSVELED